MGEATRHCPFLNRADVRCAQHLSLDNLGHALRHCFARYNECPTYVALLLERQVRRARAAATTTLPTRFNGIGEHCDERPVVQVTVSVPRPRVDTAAGLGAAVAAP